MLSQGPWECAEDSAWPQGNWENTKPVGGESGVCGAAAQVLLEGSAVEASDNSLDCLVKEPRLDPSLMSSTKDFFHHEQPSPIFVLTVHSNPVPLRLSWNPQLAPRGLSGAQPLVQGTVKGRGPSYDRFLPAALHGRRRAIFSKSPGDSAVRCLSTDSKVQFMSSIMFTNVFLILFYFEKKTKRNNFPSQYLPTHLVLFIHAAASKEWKGALKIKNSLSRVYIHPGPVSPSTPPARTAVKEEQQQGAATVRP